MSPGEKVDFLAMDDAGESEHGLWQEVSVLDVDWGTMMLTFEYDYSKCVPAAPFSHTTRDEWWE